MNLNKPIFDIVEDDIQQLINSGVAERKTVEYKSALPSNSDKDKKEFLADVSSFANASGGDLIYGITAVNGIPTAIAPLQLVNVDAEVLRLENIVRDGIRPRIPGLNIHPISTTSGTVIIMRIPKSWANPHMVIFDNHAKFYSRNSAGKYQLDVDELRSAFLLSETAVERIRSFRSNRLGNIVAGETPVPLIEQPKLVVHVIPHNAFSAGVRHDVVSLGNDIGQLRPFDSQGWDIRYNFDGIASFCQPPDRLSHNYMQIFHNGSIEAVDAFIASIYNDAKLISHEYEYILGRFLPNVFSLQQSVGVEPPVFLLLSLLGVRGYTLNPKGRRRLNETNYRIDRDNLILPEIIIEDFNVNLEVALKPAFDIIWNAAGYSGSY